MQNFRRPVAAGDHHRRNGSRQNRQDLQRPLRRIDRPQADERHDHHGRDGNRAFTKRCYLFPISQEELDRVKCTQNYGW